MAGHTDAGTSRVARTDAELTLLLAALALEFHEVPGPFDRTPIGQRPPPSKRRIATAAALARYTAAWIGVRFGPWLFLGPQGADALALHVHSMMRGTYRLPNPDNLPNYAQRWPGDKGIMRWHDIGTEAFKLLTAREHKRRSAARQARRKRQERQERRERQHRERLLQSKRRQEKRQRTLRSERR
jgi:hypothetical protein